MNRTHNYRMTNRWTGDLGTGTSTYTGYRRDHELSAPGKEAAIPGSSDPLFRGTPGRYNPEELLLGALSACHMLWVLHLCADAGIVVTGYTDEVTGEVVEHADGSAEFSRVVLHPRMSITEASRASEARAMHDRAHQVCALARSMNFPVDHEVTVLPAGASA